MQAPDLRQIISYKVITVLRSESNMGRKGISRWELIKYRCGDTASWGYLPSRDSLRPPKRNFLRRPFLILMRMMGGWGGGYLVKFIMHLTPNVIIMGFKKALCINCKSWVISIRESCIIRINQLAGRSEEKRNKETSLMTDIFFEMSCIGTSNHEGKVFDLTGRPSYLMDFTLSW